MAVLDGEIGFAASGTCLAVQGRNRVWIGAGGETSAATGRIFRSVDAGDRWTASNTPLRAGMSAGIFSIAFRDARIGIAVGGDYMKPDQKEGVVIVTMDGGSTWTKPAGTGPYRSAVACLRGTSLPTWIAVGPNGSDYSIDDGASWTAINMQPFHAVSGASDGTCWASGAAGAIARLEMVSRP